MISSADSSVGRLLFKSLVVLTGLLVMAFLLWALRSLIVPVVVSALLAYICRPLVAGLERYRVPRALGVAMLLVVFVSVILTVVNRTRAIMPTEAGAIELKVRALYALNQGYQALMELDPSLTGGNRIYRWLHADLDPLVERATQLLSLSAEERSEFLSSRADAAAPAGSDGLLAEDRANLRTLKMHARTARAEPDTLKSARPAPARVPISPVNTRLAVLAWISTTGDSANTS